MSRRFSAVAVAAFVILLASTVVAAGPQELPTSLADQKIKVEWLDWVVIVGYLVGIVVLGCLAGLRRKESKGSDYFLAGRSLTWPLIGTALFATNISSIHLVSFAQNGYTSGLTYGNFEWMAAFTLVILSLFFAPFYFRSGVATLPDFMEKRFSPATRNYLAVLSIFSAVVIHIGFSLLTASIVVEGTLLSAYVDHPEQYRVLTVLAMCGATALYTIVGGLLAVVLTESIQTVVMLAGAVCITWIGYSMAGGWTGLGEHVHPVNLSILRSSTDPTGITWYAVFLGYPVLGVWYWCTDQTIVQRVLGAKDENHARVGPLFAGFIKILPVFLFVLPGVLCLALINMGKMPPLPQLADGSPNTEQTFTHLINHLLGPGFRGLIIAALLAALMSTVSGALNSIATLFSYDIYKRFRPDADDRHLVWTGRLATFVAMCVAVFWTVLLSSQNTTLFQALVNVLQVVAPPTAVVFLWGVFWRRTSARAAFWTLILGSLAGLAINALKLLDDSGAVRLEAVSPPLAELVRINALFMAFLLFVAQSVLVVVLSLAFPHRHTAESETLVWKSPLDCLRGEGVWRGLLDFRVLALLLVVVMAGLYVAFTDRVAYYPVHGTVTLDGRPVVGATVHLDAENDAFDAALTVGPDGKFAFGSEKLAGGAPAGTKYRVRITSSGRDYLVRRDEPGPGAPSDPPTTVLAWMPAGTQVLDWVEKQEGKEQRVYVLQTKPARTPIVVDKNARVEVRRGTPIPPRYTAAETSGLGFTIGPEVNTADLRLVSGPAE